ncbi:MAG: hypothetical protein SWX82_04225 [Cyanobacteriota bacterium]|nr:hypothetical protein [Cyanobacteriota bacterium]
MKKITLTSIEVEQLQLESKQLQLEFTEKDLNEQGIWRMAYTEEEVEEKIGPSRGIITSNSKQAEMATSELKIQTRFDALERYQIPIVIPKNTGGNTLHKIKAAPNAVIPEHKHSHGIGSFRIVTKGEVIFNGVKYGPGDWFWVPTGETEHLVAGPEGFEGLYNYVWEQVDGRFEKEK